MPKSENIPSGVREIDLSPVRERPPSPKKKEAQPPVSRLEEGEQRKLRGVVEHHKIHLSRVQSELVQYLTKLASQNLSTEERQKQETLVQRLKKEEGETMARILEARTLLEGTVPTELLPKNVPSGGMAGPGQEQSAARPQKVGIKEVDTFIAKDKSTSFPALESAWLGVQQATVDYVVAETRKPENGLHRVLQNHVITELTRNMKAQDPHVELGYVDLEDLIEDYDGSQIMPKALRLANPKLEAIDQELDSYQPVMDNIEDWFKNPGENEGVSTVFRQLNRMDLFNKFLNEVDAVHMQEKSRLGLKITDADRAKMIEKIKQKYGSQIQEVLTLLSQHRKGRVTEAKQLLQKLRQNEPFYKQWLKVGEIQAHAERGFDAAKAAYQERKQRWKPTSRRPVSDEMIEEDQDVA